MSLTALAILILTLPSWPLGPLVAARKQLPGFLPGALLRNPHTPQRTSTKTRRPDHVHITPPFA